MSKVHSPSSDSAGAGAPADEIEITPEMVEAGVFALERFMDSSLTEDLVVKKVFAAMIARKHATVRE